jgi:hypothetical protein
MTKPVRIFIVIAGSLSIIAGIFLAINDSEFVEYISAIFAGVFLIASVFFGCKINSGQKENES